MLLRTCFATVLMLLAATASADIHYGVDTSLTAPGGAIGGTLRGSFVVPDSAIADGILRATEITSARFELTDTVAPFTPTVFTADERSGPFLNVDDGDTFVDRVTGAYLTRFMLVLRDTATGQVLLFGHTGVTVQMGDFSASIGREVPAVVSGGGVGGAAGGGPGGGDGDSYVYTFTTTSPAPTAGRLVGSFTVPKSAVADGVLIASEVTAYSFALVGASAPFGSEPITMYGEFISPYGNEIRVDPATGRYLSDFIWYGRNDQRQEFYVLPHRFLARALIIGQQYGLGTITVRGNAPTGAGVTPVAVPVLDDRALLLLAVLLATAAGLSRRARNLAPTRAKR